MKGSFRIARIAGIDIGVHYTWLLIFFLIAWSLAVGGAQLFNQGSTALYWVAGALAAILLFICVLIHELAHSLVAQSRGLPVKSITLFIFGGVSNIEKEPEKAGVEFTMAIVGPLSSLILGGIFLLLWLPLRGSVPFWPLGATPDTNSVAFLVHYLALINLLLGAFNLLPGFPLDGGRVFRSIVWGSTKDLKKATNIASVVGQIFGWGLIFVGVLYIFSGNWFNGIWIAFIGWFLNSAAESSRREASLQERLAGIYVKDAMDVNPETINPSTTVETVVLGVFRRQHERAVPVSRDGKVVGIVTITDIKELPQNKWPLTPVEQIMTRPPLHIVSPDDDLSSVLKLLAQHDVNQLLVFDKDQLVGIVSRADIIRWLQVNQELKIKPASRTTPR